MSIFIVRPNQSLATRAVGLISKNFAPENRQHQISELVSLRQEDPTYNELYRWLKDSRPTVNSLSRESQTPVTGTKIVNMSEEEAVRLRLEIPDLLVLRDQPLGLIQPVRSVAGAKSTISATDLWHLRAIGLSNARKNGFKGKGQGVSIAILDTGVDATHPELSNRVMGASTFDVNTWQAHSIATSIDTDGHGTHVAGLICGKKVGVAPAAQVLNGIMLPKGKGNVSDFILALEWAASQATISIVNMSAGLPGSVPDMVTAIADLLSAGVLPVMASGNEGRNRTRSPGNYAESFSVGASNQAGKVSSFSSGGVIVADNHRYEVPDIVAPGEAVYSCVMGGGYEAWNGTSMATPIVSGVAALILEKFPQISVTDLIEELITSSKDLGVSADRQGSGLIQVKSVI